MEINDSIIPNIINYCFSRLIDYNNDILTSSYLCLILYYIKYHYKQQYINVSFL